MAKTYTEYEADDIDLDNNPEHKMLFAALLGTILVGTARAKEGEDKLKPMKTGVAFFLTALEREGYVLTKRETIPSAFVRTDQ